VRILVWHVHGSWATAFVAGEHEYVVPVVADRGPEGRGRAQTWDWPATVREATPEQLADLAAGGGIDVVVLQRPEEVELLRRWTGLVPGRDVPAVYVEHNAPTGHAASTRHPLADLDVVEEGLVPIVHVTAFNALMWDAGDARTLVVDHGIPDPGHLYSGERASVGVVVNEPVRRWRVAGTDVLVEVGRHVPLDVYGMGVGKLAEHLDAPGAAPVTAGTAPHRTHGLHDDVPQAAMHARLATSRAYLHPYRWTSLGLSLLEAMALGMPVLALPTTEAPVAVPPTAGTLSSRPDELVATARRWLADPDEAREHGSAARAHVLEHYSHARFLHRWDTVPQEVTS
jgi:glycosyltransferase involved in cell wall biosynthesis